MTKFDELKRLAEAALLSGDMQERETFQSKCRPSVISGLIADAAQSEQDYKDVVGTIELRDIEIERLKDEVRRITKRLCVCCDCGGQGEIYSGHSTSQGYNQPPEPDMDVCGTCGGDGVLGPVEDFEAIAAERDQLKAQVEALKQNRLSLDNFDLDAEWTALRKDAERYRWLRGDCYHAHVQVHQEDGSQPYVYAEELDRSVDFAIVATGKGEKA